MRLFSKLSSDTKVMAVTFACLAACFVGTLAAALVPTLFLFTYVL